MLRIVLFFPLLLVQLCLLEALVMRKYSLVSSRTTGIVNTRHNNNYFMAPTQKNADIQAIIARTELLVVVPVSAVGLKQVSGLKSALIGELAGLYCVLQS